VKGTDRGEVWEKKETEKKKFFLNFKKPTPVSTVNLRETPKKNDGGEEVNHVGKRVNAKGETNLLTPSEVRRPLRKGNGWNRGLKEKNANKRSRLKHHGGGIEKGSKGRKKD